MRVFSATPLTDTVGVSFVFVNDEIEASLSTGDIPVKKAVTVLEMMPSTYAGYRIAESDGPHKLIAAASDLFYNTLKKNHDQKYLRYRSDSETSSVRELWNSAAHLCNGRASDNNAGNYPLGLRDIQLLSLETVVAELRRAHEYLKSVDPDTL